MVYEQDPWLTWTGEELQGDQVPQVRSSDVRATPRQKIVTPQEKAQREIDRQKRYDEDMLKEQQQRELTVKGVRALIQQYPEYKERFVALYPELNNIV